MDNLKIKIISEIKISEGSCELVFWNKQLSMKKAMKVLFSVWAFGALTIFIPLIHFLSVPAALLFGPIIGRAVYKLYINTVELVNGCGTCPNCSEEIKFSISEVKSKNFITCDHCHTKLQIEILEYKKHETFLQNPS